MENQHTEFWEIEGQSDNKTLLEKAVTDLGSDQDVVEHSKATRLKVLARPYGFWNNTGVYKPKGVQLVVSYLGGRWRCNPHWGPTTGAGDGRYIAGGGYLRPGAPEGCLIGKIGGDNHGGGSHTFALGNHGFIPIHLEGLLWLTVNDEPRGFGDNQDHIYVAVS